MVSGEALVIAGARSYRVLGQLKGFGFYFKCNENSLASFEEGMT